MKKILLKRKLYLDRKSRKIGEYPKRDKPYIKDKKESIENRRKYYSIAPPDNFSIIENREETLEFFIKFKDKIEQKKYVKLDFSNITNITIDSLMNILALLRNFKFKHMQFGVIPIPPKDKILKQFIEGSGFFNFATGKQPAFSNEIIEIRISNALDINNPNPEYMKTAAEICNFVSSDKTYTRNLYILLIELMSNTREHAYKPNSETLSNWYIFAKKDSNSINIVFMDTGASIPVTINKRLNEQIFGTDSHLIHSALKGECRSQTKKPNRGKGLGVLLDLEKTQYINNLKLISRKGEYPYSKEKENFKEFHGVLVHFNIKQEQTYEL